MARTGLARRAGARHCRGAHGGPPASSISIIRRRFAFDDHWFRLPLTAGERGRRRLRLHGLATLAEVWLGAEQILTTDSMFIAHDIDIDVTADNRPVAVFPLARAGTGRAAHAGALASASGVAADLAQRAHDAARPYAGLVSAGPGRRAVASGRTARRRPACIRPHRSAHAHRRRRRHRLADHHLRASADRYARATRRCIAPTPAAALAWRDARTLEGELRVPKVERWWPHTHGTPALHTVALHAGGETFDLGRVGFRHIEADYGRTVKGSPSGSTAYRCSARRMLDQCGSRHTRRHPGTAGARLRPRANGGRQHAACRRHDAVRVGCVLRTRRPARHPDLARLRLRQFRLPQRRRLRHRRDAGSHAVPRAYAALRRAGRAVRRQRSGPAGRHARAAAAGRARRRCSPPALPALVATGRPDVPYVANSPSGGDWPFSTRTGITHYYGVGAYQRPPEDVRRAECASRPNVSRSPTSPTTPPCTMRWARSTPIIRAGKRRCRAIQARDGTSTTYATTICARCTVSRPALLRYEDPQRYLDLSRAVVADLMTDVFSEWRRAGSPCGGGLVWQFQDLRPGAGWGIVDSTGPPEKRVARAGAGMAAGSGRHEPMKAWTASTCI